MNFKLALSIVIIILVVVVAGWLLYANYVPNGGQMEQESAQDSGADNTATIEAELDQIPDDTSVNSDMQSLDADVEAF